MNLFKNINKNFKMSIFKFDNHKSKKENKLEENEKSSSNKSKPNNLKWLENIKNKNEQKNKNDKFQFVKKEIKEEEMIKNAKLHRDANRPLKKLKNFDDYTKFCECCCLPIKDDIYLTNFNFCENTDNFAEYGRVPSLYFSYYRFSILIMFSVFLLMGIPSILLNNHYTSELNNICYILYKNNKIKHIQFNLTFDDCQYFLNVSEDYNNDAKWEKNYNSINLNNYRNIYKILSSSQNNVDKTLINYNFSNFIGLITIFIINLLYIILLYNLNKQYDISVTSPSDYTIMVTNLHSAFKIFWDKINKINNNLKQNKSNSSNKEHNSQEEIKEIKELGLINLVKNNEINISEGFYEFIKNNICKTYNEEIFNIYKINICYKISELMNLEESIQIYKDQLYMINNEPKQIEKNEKLNLRGDDRKFFYYIFDKFKLNPFKCSLFERSKNIKEIEENKNKLESSLQNLLNQSENLTENNFSGVIFVTFCNIKEQEKFMKYQPKNLIMNIYKSLKHLKYFLCYHCVDKKKRDRYFLRKNISFEIAPEPEDVIFENLQYSSIERLFRTILIYFISLIMIFICFLIILVLNYVQINNKKGNNNDKEVVIRYCISIVISIIISILNTLFQFFLNFLTKKEKQLSMTNYYLSYSIKLTFFTFITSGVIPLIATYYYNSKFDFDILVANILTIFLSNSFLTPLMWSLNFELLFKKLKACLAEKKCIYYTQKELNSIYELLDMGISYKYSYIAKTLLMSFFYMPIFPLGTLISFLGFVFGYFIEKFNFSNMYKRPVMLNSKICEFYCSNFVVNLFILSIGDYIFIRDINHSNFWPLLNIILFGVLIIFPYNHIFEIDLIGIEESQIKEKSTYENNYFTFFNDYEMINPMTKKEGIKNYLNKFKEYGLINKMDYQNILSNFENINLMETYYKAKKNFNNNLIQRAFLFLGNSDKSNNTKFNFVENFKKFLHKKGTNSLSFLLLNKKKKEKEENIVENDIYNIEILDSNKDSERKLKGRENDSTNESKDLNKNHLNENDKKNSEIKSKELISGKANNILSLYENPIFFGLKVLFNSVSLDNKVSNKDEKELIKSRNNNNSPIPIDIKQEKEKK